MSLRSLSTSIFSTALLLTMVLSLTPVGMAGDGDAGQAGEFLRYGVSVRSLGMGRAYVGAANDATGIYYNAAGLVRLPNMFSGYAMTFSPLLESRYSFLSAAWARPYPNAVGLKRFFFGPEAAWGFGLVHLNTGEFEYRTADDDLIDADFSMYQQAAMLAFAREFSGSGGILGLGFNLKIVRQGVSEIDAPLENSDVGFGLDFGTQLQMINPPVIKGLTSAPLIGPFFKLRHLLPLHLGLNIQNVISPQVGFGETAEKHPTTMRFGGTYFFDNLGVIDGLNLFEGSRLTLVSDLEWMFADMGKLISWNTSGQRGARWYGGIELEGQINDISLMFPRLGYNTADGPGRWGVGAGLKWVMQDWTFQFDAAYGTHAELDNDWRVSLTLSRGGKRDASYFVRESQPATSLSRRSTMLHVVSGAPDHWQDVVPAAIILAQELDTPNADRYLELIGGSLLAVSLAEKAIAAFQAGEHGEARSFALEAIAEFKKVIAKKPHVMRDYYKMLYGQCEMISAATDGGRARDAWRRATTVFAGIQIATLQKHFLTGACWHMLSEFDNAATSFSAALETGTDEAQSMRKLSRLWLGDALMNGGRPDSAIVVLSSITDDHTLQEGEVDADYPRYWTFSDMQITDDAQYLKAQCYLKKNDEMAAAAEFLKVCRFYSGSDKCSGANNEADKLIQRLLEKTR